MRRPVRLMLVLLAASGLGASQLTGGSTHDALIVAAAAPLRDEIERLPRDGSPGEPTTTSTTVRPATTTVPDAVQPASTTSSRPRPTQPTTTTSTVPGPEPATSPTVAPAPTAPPPTSPPTTQAPAGQYNIARTNLDGSAVRWNPCQQIRVVINLQQAPSFARAELGAALAALRSASGLDIVDAGTTTERPVGRLLVNPSLYGAGYVPILVSFASAAELPFGSPTASGWGQAVPVLNPATGNLQYVTGQVVLRPDHGWTQGTSSANPLSIMLRHELGHVLGLAHVSATNEIMTTAGNGSARTWGPGDLRGLAAVGRPAGCLPALP